MKRREVLTGFRQFQSEKRLNEIELNWQYLPPLQQLRFALLIRWHSFPTLYQLIEHIKYFALRWLTYRVYPAHWLRHE